MKEWLKRFGILVFLLGIFSIGFSAVSDKYVQSSVDVVSKNFGGIPSRITQRLVPAFGPFPDPSLWTTEGRSHKVFSDKSIIFDLGNGVMRRDFADGNSEIRGLVYQGTPVYYLYTPNAFVWSIDMEQIVNFYSDSGVQNSVLTFTGGRELHIITHNPLSAEKLSFISDAINEAPAKTFAPLMNPINPEIAIYIFDSLGEKRSGDGKIYPIHGLAENSMVMAIRSSALESKEMTEKLLYHEAGHLLDHENGVTSQAILGADQKPIFGSGEEADFVSEVARQNAFEDFAETHSRFLILRTMELKEGKELLEFSPAELDRFLKTFGYSPKLREKFEKLAEKLYSKRAKSPDRKVGDG